MNQHIKTHNLHFHNFIPMIHLKVYLFMYLFGKKSQTNYLISILIHSCLNYLNKTDVLSLHTTEKKKEVNFNPLSLLMRNLGQ